IPRDREDRAPVERACWQRRGTLPFSEQRLQPLRPLAEYAPLPSALRNLDRHEVSGHAYLVQSDARHAVDLRVEAGVVVAEEADAGTNAADEVVETSGFARPVETAPVPRKHDARRCVVGEEEI